MLRFDFQKTPLADLMLIQRKRIVDQRGFFSRFFCYEEFAALGLNKSVSQINHSMSLLAAQSILAMVSGGSVFGTPPNSTGSAPTAMG